MIRILAPLLAMLSLTVPASALELTGTAPKALNPKPVAPVTGVVCDEDANDI